MKPDLTTLYSELGLAPDCSLAEFQVACRRRISELQPRRLGRAASPESHAELRDLIALYTTATRFHRRYGRLPGAAPDRPPRGTAVGSRVPRARPAGESAVPRGEPPSRLALVLGALLALLFAAVALVSGEWFR
jgi:hypothetical protein